MRILLIHPIPPPTQFPRGLFRSRWAPSGAAMVGAALQRAGHDVRIHVREEHLVKRSGDRAAADGDLLAEIEQFRPEMAGLSMTSAVLEDAEWAASRVKRICGEHVLVMAGGPHPTALPEETLADCPSLDVIVIGEGEETAVDLAANGPGLSVRGIAWRDGEEVRRGEPRPAIADLNTLAPIDYSMFDMAWYAAPDRWMVRWLMLPATNIRTSRGCTNRCRFCAGHVATGVGVRHYDLQRVTNTLEHVTRQFGVRGIRFEDDTLGADRDRLIRLCRAMRQRGLAEKLQWECCLRVDQVDAGLLREMKAAGCVQVECGFESGHNAGLRGIGKAATAEENRRAVRLLREAGIRIFADIMIGLPGETAEGIRQTIQFMRWMKPEVIGATVLAPLPGTAIYESLPRETQRSLDWSKVAYMAWPGIGVNFTAMPDREFSETARRYFKYFIRPWLNAQLLRDLPAEGHDEERRRLRKKMRRFAWRHPIRYSRLPL